MVQTRTKKYKVAKKTAAPVKSKKPSRWTTTATDSVRVTRAMATNSPRQAVFETAELLEQILLHLPIDSLWTCQRVCKQFHAMTRTSPALQEEMMFRPRDQPRHCWRLEFKGWDHPDPLTRARFVIQEPKEPLPPRELSYAPRIRAFHWTPARLCPLLSVSNAWHEAAKRNSAFRVQGQQGEHVRFNWSPDLWTSGPWQNMLVTDPPCFEAKVELRFVVGHWGIPDGTFSIQRKVENPEGLRMGDLVLGALKMPGMVDWSLNGRHYRREYKRPEKVLIRLEDRLGVKALLDVGDKGSAVCWTRVWLDGMVIPTEEERLA